MSLPRTESCRHAAPSTATPKSSAPALHSQSVNLHSPRSVAEWSQALPSVRRGQPGKEPALAELPAPPPCRPSAELPCSPASRHAPASRPCVTLEFELSAPDAKNHHRFQLKMRAVQPHRHSCSVRSTRLNRSASSTRLRCQKQRRVCPLPSHPNIPYTTKEQRLRAHKAATHVSAFATLPRPPHRHPKKWLGIIIPKWLRIVISEW